MFNLQARGQLTTFLLIHQVQPQASKHVCFSLTPAISCCQCVNIKDECHSTFPGRCLISMLMHGWGSHVKSIMMSIKPKCLADTFIPGHSKMVFLFNFNPNLSSIPEFGFTFAVFYIWPIEDGLKGNVLFLSKKIVANEL